MSSPLISAALELHQSEEILQSGFAERFCRFALPCVEYQGLHSQWPAHFPFLEKTKRVWMAGMVFVSVVAFVVSPAIQFISDGARAGGNAADPLEASWNGGSIRQKQLYREHDELRLANQFLRKLATEVMAKGGRPNVPFFNPQMGEVGIATEENPGHIIQRKLYLAEASRRGIIFNNDSVKRFLKEFCNGKLNGDAVQKIFTDTTERRLTWVDFNRLMCEELAHNEVARISMASVQFEDQRDSQRVNVASLSTPSKNWQDFLRFNQKAKIQAFPVYAKDFESDVKEKPSEREVQELFNEGRLIAKTSRVLPTQPAFLKPKSADFEYLMIDEDKVLAEQMALIPEATLRAEYDRRVASGDKKLQVPVTPEATSTVVPEKNDATPADMPEATSTAVPDAGAAAATPPAEPAASDAPIPAAVPQATPTTDSPSAPAETPAPPAETPTPADEPPQPADAPKANALRQNGASNIRLVSYQEGTPTPAPATPPQDAPPTPPQDAPAIPPASAEPTAATSEAAPTTATPETAQNTPADAGSIQLSDAPAGTDLTTKDKENAVPEVPMRTLSFEEAKDQIAREQSLKATEMIVEERLNMLMSPMSIYQAELANYRQMLEQKEKGAKEPKRPDLAQLGKPLGFEQGTTGMITSDSAKSSVLGMVYLLNAAEQRLIQMSELVEGVRGPADMFSPNVSFKMGNQRFLFWKVAETQPVPPTVESVREEIVQVWSKQQAFKLAEKRAREIASKVGSSPLVDALVTAEEKAPVVEPSAFTWFNPMFARMQNSMVPSNVEQLQPTDGAFMEAVFSCPLGDSTVAPDVNRTVYYVVKVVELTPDTQSLLEKFATTPLEGVATIAREESFKSRQSWNENLHKQLGFRRN